MKKKKSIQRQIEAEYANIESTLKELKVLIIEDHPLMQTAIANAFDQLSKSQENYNFQIDTAFNCKEAHEKISKKTNRYDLIMLDIQLPVFPPQKLFSGEDIGKWVKNTIHPIPKIIVVTLIKDSYRVENIIKSINPDGFLVKSDITPETLIEAIKNIFDSNPYYSESITRNTHKIISSNLVLDETDRQILYEIANGANMIELQKILLMSKSTLQKRKGRLMDIFNVSDHSNRELVLKAKDQGFI